MKKIDTTVKNETGYIACWVVILSAIMQAVFLVAGRWDFAVLLGNLLGGALVILNFFLMGITVQKALEKEEKDAKTLMKLSQTYRMFMMLVVVGVGVLLPYFNTGAVILPVLFPRVAILLRPLVKKEKD